MLYVVNGTRNGLTLWDDTTFRKHSYSIKRVEEMLQQGTPIANACIAPQVNPIYKIGNMIVDVYRIKHMIIGRFNVCFVNKGLAYGRTLSSIYDADTIEFYDAQHVGEQWNPCTWGINGQFIGSYYKTDILSHKGMLRLNGEVPAWTIDEREMEVVKSFISKVHKR